MKKATVNFYMKWYRPTHTLLIEEYGKGNGKVYDGIHSPGDVGTAVKDYMMELEARESAPYASILAGYQKGEKKDDTN